MEIRPFQDVPAPSGPAPAPKPPAPAPADAEFSYNSQDTVVMPSAPTVVHGVKPGPEVEKARLSNKLEPVDGKYVYEGCDPRHTQAVSFAAAAKTVEVFAEALGHPVSWAFSSPKLSVTADEGAQLNAYYSRNSGGVHFFHGTDPVTGATALSGASGEVVSHEVGHAMLDGLRPGYLGTWSPDPGGFHEAFGDIVGMLMGFQDERSINRVIVQTGGDLTKPNVLAHTGEHLGIAINDTRGSNAKGTGGDYVRTAINKFTWAEPSTLPYNPGPDGLGSEVHSYGKLWSGAFYDVMVAINSENMAKGMDPKAALKATGTEGLKLMGNLMKIAPQGDFTYRDMAEAFVSSDQQFNGGQRADLLKQVFTDRLILPAEAPPAPPAPAPKPLTTPANVFAGPTGIFTTVDGNRTPLSDVAATVRVRLSGSEFGMYQGAVVDTVVDKDGALTKSTEISTRTQSSLKQLIDAGRIRFNDPTYKMKPEDYFDKNGVPYMGVVRWEGDQMVIERVKIAS